MGFYILWNTPYPVGGVTAFCVHLHLITGAPIIRLSNVNQEPRSLGGWGVSYQNMTIDSIVKLDAPILLGGGSWTIDPDLWKELFKRVCVWTVLHDETEFKSMPHTVHIRGSKAIVMREYNLTHYPTATLLPQPYKPRFVGIASATQRTTHAICTARLDKIKGTEIIVQANRLLPEYARVRLYGSPNRMWVFGKRAKLPELQGLKGYPPTFGAGADLHARAVFGVDMTVIGLDGGVQYTLLEALDAGSIPILTPSFSMRDLIHHVAGTPAELARIILDRTYSPKHAAANRAWLDSHHAPARVGARWRAVVR